MEQVEPLLLVMKIPLEVPSGIRLSEDAAEGMVGRLHPINITTTDNHVVCVGFGIVHDARIIHEPDDIPWLELGIEVGPDISAESLAAIRTHLGA